MILPSYRGSFRCIVIIPLYLIPGLGDIICSDIWDQSVLDVVVGPTSLSYFGSYSTMYTVVNSKSIKKIMEGTERGGVREREGRRDY